MLMPEELLKSPLTRFFTLCSNCTNLALGSQSLLPPGFNSGTINPLTFCVTAQYQWVYLSCYQSKQDEQWIRCFLLIDIPIRIWISIENGIYFIICISHNIVRIGSCIIPIVFLITVRLSSFISEIIRNFEGFHVFKNLQ